MEPSTPAAPEQPTAPSQDPPADATAAATNTAATPAPPPPAPAPSFAPISPAERAWLTFPPFPKPPPGVELIAFKDFKPLGIIIPEGQGQGQGQGQERGEGEDAPVEVDGLGIQTLTLRVHHDLTTMEKRKRKNVKTKTLADGTTVLKRWYDEWAEGESLRRTSCPIDPSLPRVDRLYQAAHDFKAGRPTIQNQAVNQMLTQYWDKFRLFVGLISGVQSTAVRKKNAAMRALAAQQAAAAAEDDEDDDELDEMPNASLPKRETTINVRTGGGADDPGAPGPSANPTGQYSEEERQHRREYFREVRDTKMDRFLNDPENVVKVFFSNYASDRGDLSSEKFCNNAPMLIDFFLKFLQRNRVFPDIDRQLRKAIAVAEQAIKELPHGIAMNKVIPDDFGRGCQQLYGNMNGYNVWEADSSEEDDDQEEARASKKQKTEDAPSNITIDQATSSSSALEPVLLDPTTAAEADVLKAALGGDLEVITPEVAKGMEKELKTLGPSAHENDWGQVPTSVNAEPGVSWGNAPTSAWGADDDDPFLQASNAADWDCGPETNLVHRFLGPTTLALTHTTGVIERSTRRIKSVVVPPAPSASAQQPQKKKKKAGKGTLEPAPPPSPEGVERELETRLARVTLAPWPAYAVHANADVQKPRVLPDSRGAAVLDDGTGAEVAPGPGAPHNPFKDDIVVYVAPEIAERMWVGMSIEGVWVQLARVDLDVPIEVTDEQFKGLWGNKKKAEGGPGVPVAPTKMWYVEEVRMVLPSFHTEMTPLPTDEDVFGAGENPSAAE